LSIDKDSSQEEEPLISLEKENNESASFEWTEINVNDDDIDDLAEVVITDNSKDPISALGINSPLAGNEPVDLKTPNTIEVNDFNALNTREPEKEYLDKSSIASVEDYREGKTKVTPLEGRRVGARTGLEDSPSFLSGRFARFQDRGLPYPQPGKLVFTSLLVLITRLSLITTLVILPLSLYIGSTEFGLWVVLPVVASFLLLCVMHFMATHQTRCRVCSCHFYRAQRCKKHRLAHKLPLLGYAFGGATHLLLFRWMRCMYCGTAIRLRQKTYHKDNSEES